MFSSDRTTGYDVVFLKKQDKNTCLKAVEQNHEAMRFVDPQYVDYVKKHLLSRSLNYLWISLMI